MVGPCLTAGTNDEMERIKGLYQRENGCNSPKIRNCSKGRASDLKENADA